MIVCVCDPPCTRHAQGPPLSLKVQWPFTLPSQSASAASTEDLAVWFTAIRSWQHFNQSSSWETVSELRDRHRLSPQREELCWWTCLCHPHQSCLHPSTMFTCVCQCPPSWNISLCKVLIVQGFLGVERGVQCKNCVKVKGTSTCSKNNGKLYLVVGNFVQDLKGHLTPYICDLLLLRFMTQYHRVMASTFLIQFDTICGFCYLWCEPQFILHKYT